MHPRGDMSAMAQVGYAHPSLHRVQAKLAATVADKESAAVAQLAAAAAHNARVGPKVRAAHACSRRGRWAAPMVVVWLPMHPTARPRLHTHSLHPTGHTHFHPPPPPTVPPA